MTAEKQSAQSPGQGSGLSRRRFLLTGGLVLGGTTAVLYFGKGPLRRGVGGYLGEIELHSGVLNREPDLWLEVRDDNTILLKSPKVEMGQDIFTGFALLVAEELDVLPEAITVVPGSAQTSARDYVGTSASTSTASLYVPLRQVAATFREMLKLAAARRWGVEVEAVTTQLGHLLSGSDRVSYAELVQSTTEWEKPGTPELRPPSSFRYVGRETKRTDLLPKILGESIYAMDAELPDMLYAMVLNNPTIGGQLESMEVAQAEAVPGVVRVIEEDGLVAVVAENRYAAERGKRQLNARWTSQTWQQADIEELVRVGNGPSVRVQSEGDVASVFAEAPGEVLEAAYRTPLVAHAHMEPNGVVADVHPDHALIITGTQVVSLVQGRVAEALGLGRDQVEVRNCFLGGGFGRRFFLDNAADAARIAQAVGRPVHVFQDREDEFQSGYCRPNTHQVLRGRLSSTGSLVALEHLLATGEMVLDKGPFKVLNSALGADWFFTGHGLQSFYDASHKNAEMWQKKLPFQTGIWRGVGMYTTTFAKESFMDELAVQAGADPLEFRLRHLTSKDPVWKRMRQVLTAAAAASGWARPRTGDVGWGIACAEDRETVVATVVQVSVAGGQIRVKKVTQAVDPGMVIHPAGVRAQVEGCTMMGISTALHEELRVENGRIHATNFHRYPMASLKDTPEIEILLFEGADKPHGVGEPPIAPVAPAIANAVYNLTGQRLRNLPLRLS